jgi:hypothetical protein
VIGPNLHDSRTPINGLQALLIQDTIDMQQQQQSSAYDLEDDDEEEEEAEVRVQTVPGTGLCEVSLSAESMPLIRRQPTTTMSNVKTQT